MTSQMETKALTIKCREKEVCVCVSVLGQERARDPHLKTINHSDKEAGRGPWGCSHPV